MTTVLLSLVAATCYGLSDFAGGYASGRVSPWSVALVAQLFGGSLTTVASFIMAGEPTTGDLWWSIAAGVANGLGTAFLYRGLGSGRMGVVAPISGVGAIVLPVLVGLLTGERPGPLLWAGLVLALPAVWLVSRVPATADHLGPDRPRGGVLDGILAGLGFGALFAILAEIPASSGLLPLAVNQLVAGVAIVVVAILLGASWVPREPAAAIGVVSGAMGMSATVAFLWATSAGLLSVAAVITSLYPAVTIMLAFAFLGEQVHRAQAIGLALCTASVVLVAAG